MHSDEIKAEDNRPIAFLLATAYPGLWARFVSACRYEAQFDERDTRLLEPASIEQLVA